MVQFLVDMGTDSKLLERTEEVAKKVAADNPHDFKNTVAVSAQIGSENSPMKFVIQVYWCFCYNGEQVLRQIHCMQSWEIQSWRGSHVVLWREALTGLDQFP